MVAILTGDVVNSSKLTTEQRSALINKLEQFLEVQKKTYSDMEFEIYRGDAVQIKLYQPDKSITLAIIIRVFVLSLGSDIRISIGIGDIDITEKEIKISSGQAFVFSGHSLDSMKSRDRLIFKSPYEKLDVDINVVNNIMMALINMWTLNRSKIMLHLLLGISRDEICKKFGFGNPTLSKTLLGAGYPELKDSIQWAENKINSYLNVC